VCAQVLVRKPPTKSKPASNEWFLFNDTVVEPIRADDVRVTLIQLFFVFFKKCWHVWCAVRVNRC
jgi:hypothetical protein